MDQWILMDISMDTNGRLAHISWRLGFAEFEAAGKTYSQNRFPKIHQDFYGKSMANRYRFPIRFVDFHREPMAISRSGPQGDRTQLGDQKTFTAEQAGCRNGTLEVISQF